MVVFESVRVLADALRRAQEAHHVWEAQNPDKLDHHWADWYAQFMVEEWQGTRKGR
jgi:hypothetical protein